VYMPPYWFIVEVWTKGSKLSLILEKRGEKEASQDPKNEIQGG